ncbi:MAG: menaquinone biosynthetic enzyme [Frankiales bacterium]|nr:menaquinone biosynthetic enzyme [Frankiales bacterium]
MLLAVVATPQECRALLGGLTAVPLDLGPYRALSTPAAVVVVSGIGPAAAAAATATALAVGDFELALSLGICGGFPGAAAIGDVVVATDLIAADLGAGSPEGFLAMGQLGWADDSHSVDPVLIKTVADRLGEVVTGPVITVSTVTGTAARVGELAERHGAVAEAMEGWGVLTAALPHGLPVLEVRTVSNAVGVRDTIAWDFPAAFEALERVGQQLLGEPWH